MHIDTEKTAKIFKSLCDENRVEIIKLLQTGEKCACHISDFLNLSQSKLSYHMKILVESGLVECWYEGKWTHYKINKAGCEYAISIIKEITTVTETSVACGCST